MTAAVIFLLLFFGSFPSSETKVFIPQNADEKPSNTSLAFINEMWKIDMKDKVQLSAFFIHQKGKPFEFTIKVPDLNKLGAGTKIKFDFGNQQEMIFKLSIHSDGKTLLIDDGKAKKLLGSSDKLSIPFVVFPNGSIIVGRTPGELNLTVNSTDIGEGNFAMGFTLTAENVMDVVE
uniref:Uncharacterized protein n=1 Tax=Panagrolaimus sp. JU765 TaxID=591449 RepID=A0AC34R2B8_9BILA